MNDIAPFKSILKDMYSKDLKGYEKEEKQAKSLDKNFPERC